MDRRSGSLLHVSEQEEDAVFRAKEVEEWWPSGRHLLLVLPMTVLQDCSCHIMLPTRNDNTRRPRDCIPNRGR